MSLSRLFGITLPLIVLCACSGGGGGSTPSPVTPWEKFRRDANNTGQASGVIASNTPHTQAVQIDAPPTPPATSSTPGAISSSPAIALDGTVYVGSEGGTLAALDSKLNVRWRVTTCSVCPAGPQDLGPLVSSPAIYSLNGQTSIFIGSTDGSVFVFQDTGSTQPTCTACFQPRPADVGSNVAITASFVSSPSFTTDPVVFTANGIFIGARIDVQPQPAGSPRSIGKLYALNSDGSVKWQFPRPGDTEIAPVTSSPALGIGGTWYFTDADGVLYALTGDGTLKWKTPIGPVLDPSTPFVPSPLTTANFIVSATADGDIFAITPDQLFSWRVSSGDNRFTSSLATGALVDITPTVSPSPAATDTPQSGPTATPTPTPTAGITSFIFGVTKSGQVVALDIAMPIPTVFPPQTPIPTPVISSPALSVDGFLVFGTSDGMLHAVNTRLGTEPSGWPVPLTNGVPIRSSPSISDSGVVYVGADDGMLYAVGTP